MEYLQYISNAIGRDCRLSGSSWSLPWDGSSGVREEGRFYGRSPFSKVPLGNTGDKFEVDISYKSDFTDQVKDLPYLGMIFTNIPEC